MRPSVLVLLALAGPASAVQPTQYGLAEQVPGRVHDVTASGQATARAGASWQDFIAGDGASWQARFDQVTGAPLRAHGPPIALGRVRTADEATTAALVFLSRHPGLAGVDVKSLVPRSSAQNPVNSAWYVDLQQTVDGVLVEDAVVTFRIVNDRLVQFGSTAVPATVAPVATLRPQDAVDIAISAGPAADVQHEAQGVAFVLLPSLLPGGLVARPAWRVSTETQQPRGQWVTWVDADTGVVLRAINNVKHISGTVEAEHDARTVNGDRAISPLPYARLFSDPSSFTGADGAYDLPDTVGPVTGDLRGRYFRIRNEDGPEAEFTVNGGDPVLTDADAHIAELDAYVFAHRIRAWGQRVAPEVDLGVMNVYVNVEGSCNAWYDGDLNFLRTSNDCNNTARVSDIVFHEWGHGFHGESLLSGVWDGSMGEGIGDTIAFLQTGDARIGPYFLRSGGPVRNVNADRVYPDDYTPNADYVHSNGLIFGSAMWDLRGELIDQYGEEEGTERITRILTGLVKGGPTLETVFDEALFADDDDGDLSNGTPNACDLIRVFGEHGLVGTRGDGPVTAQHAPVRDAMADEPTPIDVDVVNSAPDCIDFDPEQAFVTYRVNGGDWQSADLVLSMDDASGAIPGQSLGTFVEYYVTVVDEGGAAIETPDHGDLHPFSLYVGDVLPVYQSDFEDDDGGFTSELLSGEDSDGANDWQHGRPGGQGGDPASAASGANIWGNDRSPEPGWDGQYQNDRHNRLSSPAIDTAHYDGVFLRYERWLTVEDAVFDQARILADGDVVWTNHKSSQQRGAEHHIDRQWQPHAVDLGDRASDGSVVISWEIETDAGLTFGGWNIDDVSLFAPNTPDNRLGISDLSVTASEDGRDVLLEWTNPVHAPLAEVLIVRTRDALPGGPTDGDVIATLTDVAIGETVTFVDDSANRRHTLGYAVYPSDGTDALSWTRDGLNAGTIRLADAEGVKSGCACSASPSPLSAAWLLGLGALFLRRRR